MVVQVLEVGQRRVVHDRHVPAQQGVHHVALRSQDAPQLEQLALDGQHLAQGAGPLAASHDPVLQGVDSVREPIQEREVAVDDRVQDGVQESADRGNDGLGLVLEAGRHLLDGR